VYGTGTRPIDTRSNRTTSSENPKTYSMNNDFNGRIHSMYVSTENRIHSISTNNEVDTGIISSSGNDTDIISQSLVSINSITSHPTRHKGYYFILLL
jgi:hypothetical protein